MDATLEDQEQAIAHKRPIPLPSQVVKAKADYILGLATIDSISKTYDLNREGLYLRSKTEKWTELREQFTREDDRLTIGKHIARLDEMMASEEDPANLDRLSRAHGKLYATLWGITGHPKPPTAKARTASDPAKAAMLAKLGSGKRSRPAPKQAQAPQPSAYWDYEGY